MKAIKIYEISILSVLVFIFGCSKSQVPDDIRLINNTSKHELRLTDNNSVEKISLDNLKMNLKQKYKTKIKPSNFETSIFIGCGYDPDFSNKPVLVSNLNIRTPVIDLNNNTLKRVYTTDLNEVDLRIRAYYDFIEDYSSFIYSISDSSNYRISIKSFDWLLKASASYKNKIRHEVSLSDSSSQKNVYCTSSLEVKNKKISFHLGALRRFNPDQYLNPLFFAEYHISSPNEIFKDYGPFVLMDYNIGGKISTTAGYTSKKSKSAYVLKTESSKMTKFTISGLFGHIGGNISNGITINRDDYNTLMKGYSDATFNTQCFGGSASNFPLKNFSYNDLLEAKFPSLDIASWLNSISDFPVLSSINKNGLIPIYQLIKEINISKDYENFFLYGKPVDCGQNNINYVVYRDGRTLLFVMHNIFGHAFILDDYMLPEIGYEWWLYYKPSMSIIPFVDDLHVEYKTGKPDLLNSYDLRPILKASDPSKINISFCRVKDSLCDEMCYLLIENKEIRKSVAFSFIDQLGFSDYGFKEPENFRILNSLNYVDLLGL